MLLKVVWGKEISLRGIKIATEFGDEGEISRKNAKKRRDFSKKAMKENV